MEKVMIISTILSTDKERHYVLVFSNDKVERHLIFINDIAFHAGVRLISNSYKEADDFVRANFISSGESRGAKS